MKTVLFWDTSQTGAGVLLSRDGHRYTLHAYQTVKFFSPEGEAQLTTLFTAAAALKAGTAAEMPQGYDSRGQAIRARANQVIGVLKLLAAQHGVKWAGDIAPITAKAALAGGRAKKKDMILMANAVFGLSLSLPADEHIADAIGGAMAALDGRFIQRKTGGKCHKNYAAKQAAKREGGLL